MPMITINQVINENRTLLQMLAYDFYRFDMEDL